MCSSDLINNASATDSSAEALLILSDENALFSSPEHYPRDTEQAVTAARLRLEGAGLDWRSAAIEARYARVAEIHREVTTEIARTDETFSDKLDRIVTHRVWGTLIFVGIMTVMFQSIFSFARIPMEAIQSAVEWFGGAVGGASLCAKAAPTPRAVALRKRRSDGFIG